MPRPRPPHLHREVSRHGKTTWYVRQDKGPRIRIRADFGTPEFEAEYQAAIKGEALPRKPGQARAGSLEWLIQQYRESSAWRAYSMTTRRQREHILRQIIETAGREPFTRITEKTIVAGRERRAGTPFQARHFVDVMRSLFAWAKETGHVQHDPAAKVAYPPMKSGDGFPAWTDDDVAAFRRRWPLGTRQHVWLAVLLYTGFRRGDAVRLGRQHVRDGIARIRTEKTETPVTIRLLPPLLEAIEAGPTGDMAYICGANGKPLTKESFGNEFGDACRKAGIRKSAHGIRKLAAITMALNGANNAELNAMFGWRGAKMAALYTQAADRERLALGAADKLLNETSTSIPAPMEKVRAGKEKD
ncbi:MAG: tyrosine-type recombinase/integrase [Pseudomonadota bacterium]